MPTRHGAIARLAGLGITLTTFAAVFAVGGAVGSSSIRDWIEPAGVAAPLLYLLISGVLGAVLVPGAALAAAAGLLFGAVAGALISLPAAVLSAVLAQRFSRRAGGVAFRQVSGPRLAALSSFARRHGVRAVIIQRLLPAVPDGPLSHAFGLAGVRTREIALGTLIASGPRALAYALLGSSAGNLTGPNAIAGVLLNVGTGAVGLALAWVVLRQERERARVQRSAEKAADASHGSEKPLLAAVPSDQADERSTAGTAAP